MGDGQACDLHCFIWRASETSQYFVHARSALEAQVLFDEQRYFHGELDARSDSVPNSVWDNSLPAWLSAQAGGHQSAGNFTPWHNMNHAERIPGSKTLLTFLGEPETSLYGDLSESELLGVMMDRLRRAHPDKNIPDGVAAWMKNWGSDLLFYGAYVDYAPGVSWSGKWKKSLTRDGETLVQFAGEAACSSMDGYTHGALYSGVQAAANYLYQIGQGPDPSTDDALSLCDWSDSDAETVVV